MNKTSFTLTAQSIFKAELSDQEPIFSGKGIVLTQQRHNEWPAHTQWGIGSSAICARFILDLLPKNHVRASQMRYRDDPTVLLADMFEISEAAFKAVLAWELSGGEHGPVSLEPSEPLLRPSIRSRAKGIFKSLLAQRQPVFGRTNDYLLVRKLNESWRYPSLYKFGRNLRDAHAIASYLPSDHVRHIRLIVKSTNVCLAYVIMLSGPAMMAVCAWEECERSNDIRKVNRKIDELARYE